jgi:excisionase family DNA binding protein
MRPPSQPASDAVRFPNPGTPNGDLSLPLPPEFLEAVAERAAAILAERQVEQAPAAPYLTVAEAAEYLRATPKRIYDLTGQRRLPFVKDGTRTLLRRADLDAYLADSAR